MSPPTTSRREFVRLLGAGGVAGTLAGCDSAVDQLSRALANEKADFRPPTDGEIDDVSHVINRLTHGPTPGEYRRVKAIGVEAFIDEQLAPDSLNDRACEWKVRPIETLHEPRGELFNHHPRQLLADLTRAKLLRAVSSRRQLQEVMVDFWTDHFNVVSDKGDCKWLKVADDRDVIRAHALGNFREMLRASALSPAMLVYLDGHDNRVAHVGDRPNENYSRELLELHTLGVHGGYTQDDVMEVARCLSGWTYGHTFLRPDRVSFVPSNHDDGAKRVLGIDIPAGGGGQDLDRVIEIVASHPATARSIATKLCRRLIDDPAPPEAVIPVARAFAESGGDIRATLRAVFATNAFREMRGNLFKRPFHFVASALRATDARTDVRPVLVQFLERMGHAPFQYPTPDGYPLEEQPWLGTLLWRWNFALALEQGRMEGTTVRRDELIAAFGSPDAAAAHVLGRAPTREEMDVLRDGDMPLALLLSSPAFQRF